MNKKIKTNPKTPKKISFHKMQGKSDSALPVYENYKTTELIQKRNHELLYKAIDKEDES